MKQYSKVSTCLHYNRDIICSLEITFHSKIIILLNYYYSKTIVIFDCISLLDTQWWAPALTTIGRKFDAEKLRCFPHYRCEGSRRDWEYERGCLLSESHPVSLWPGGVSRENERFAACLVDWLSLIHQPYLHPSSRNLNSQGIPTSPPPLPPYIYYKS